MKTLVTLFLVLLVNLSLSAQITLGLSGGLNFSTAKFKDHFRSIDKGYLGIHGGLSGKYQITDLIYFSLEGQFSEKGFDPEGKSRFSGFDQPIPIGFKETVYKKQYFDVIPEVEFRILDWFSIGMGAQYGFFLEGLRKSEGESWLNDRTSGEENDIGITSSLKFYFKKLFTTFRYNYGLHDLETSDLIELDGTNVDIKQFNRNFQIGLGYNIVPFKIKKKQKGPWY